MSGSQKRPPIRVHFRYNLESGEVEELLIDDNAPGRTDDYHDKVADLIASRLGRDFLIEDIGQPETGINDQRGQTATWGADTRREDEQEPETEVD